MIKSVCFLTTYRCNARCGFCECRPESKEMLTLADMIRYMDEAVALIRKAASSNATVLGAAQRRPIGGEAA